jgi:hypothetical protein
MSSSAHPTSTAPSACEAKYRANAFAAGEDAVAHGGVDGNGQRGFAGEDFLQRGLDQHAISFEEFGSSHG